MESLLITDACLLGLSLIQAVLGIIVFKPRPAVISFFIQCFFLFASAVIATILVSREGLIAGWMLAGLF